MYVKEKIENIKLCLKNEFRKAIGKSKEGRDFDYSKVTLIEELTPENTYKGHKWGKYHPNQLWQYFDDNMVSYKDNVWYLRTQYKPEKFDDIVIPYATGVVNSKNHYQYGYFETFIFLPTGENQWPAFWLSGEHTWPPEIDIIEGYSKKDDYNNYRRLQPNVHYGLGYDKKSIGAVNIPIPYYVGLKPFKVGVDWTKDYIKFYYNGYLVKVVYDKNVLEHMNQPMGVIINSAVQTNKASDSISAFESPKIYKHL